MAKPIDPHLVVTPRQVLFSCVVNDTLERVKVPRELIDRAQGRPLQDGEAWALINDRMDEIGIAREDGANLHPTGDAIVPTTEWMKLLGPR